MSDEQRKRFETTKELDFSFGIKNLSRYRANVFLQRGVVSRWRSARSRSRSCRSRSSACRRWCASSRTRMRGLVLLTGPTGSGKSTTLAAMIDKINATRQCHIMTIEDPIEYIHHHKKSIVNQREVGADTDVVPDRAQVRAAAGPGRHPDR